VVALEIIICLGWTSLKAQWMNATNQRSLWRGLLMSVKRQHYVPRVYLKNWETRVSSKSEPGKYFQGIYYYEKDDLGTGDGKNKNSVLWESRLYNIDYELSFIIPSCPIIEEDYIAQIDAKLTSRGVDAYFNGEVLKDKESLKQHFFKLDEWEFRHKEPPMKLAKRQATLSDIKSIHSYILENALDDVVEKKWQPILDDFIHQMETTVPLNGIDEIRRIDESLVVDIIKMVIFLMCRNPDFDYLGILPKILNIFQKPLKDITGTKNTVDVEDFLQIQQNAAWLRELYNGLFEVPKGYFYTMKTTAQSTFQMILFKTWENQGSFITSDKPAFLHDLLVEATNNNAIYCPLTPDYLVMITKGEKHSLRDVNFRMANNDLIKKFNRMILSHANKAIVSDYKHLGYLL